MEIALYVLAVMYSPGPVNLLALNAGLAGLGRRAAGYCLGVGAAMFGWFAVLGYLGQAVAHTWRGASPYLVAAGSAYILYLGCRLLLARPGPAGAAGPRHTLRFADGFLLQALNPKGMVVILPVVTVMFPAAHIAGARLLAAVALISMGAVGAPASYCVAGAIAGKRIRSETWLARIERVTGLLLVAVALSLLYDLLTMH